MILTTMFNRMLAVLRHARYPGSMRYWEKRYAAGGTSGAGSAGRLADYKAGWLNAFVRENGVRSVVEFGCGDGQQLLQMNFPAYLGLDVAPAAVARCRTLFAGDPSKQFALYEPLCFDPAGTQADLAISLEVVFHLTEDALYHLYMQHLFASARRWVVIFSSDDQDASGTMFPHFRSRHFTPDVPAGWALRERVSNPHADISISDFFVFEKNKNHISDL